MCDVKPFGELSKEEKMGLLEAWVDAEIIEYSTGDGIWITVFRPGWVPSYLYRIQPKPVTKPSVDWRAVDARFKFLFKTSGDVVYMSTKSPLRYGEAMWDVGCSEYIRVDRLLSSCELGTCHWIDSLVERPEGV